MTFLQKASSTRARLVKRGDVPCLLASFGASNPPLLWQFDLEKISSHCITIAEKNKGWDLGFVMPHGVFSPVAHFDERFEAEEAYLVVQKTLMQSHKNIKSGGVGHFLLLLVFLVFAFFAFSLFSSDPKSPVAPALLAPQMQGQYIKPEAPAARQEINGIQTGVPVSADDVLQ